MVADEFKENREKWWRIVAGPRLQSMLESRTAAEAFLDDPAPEIRHVAISIVRFHWRPTWPFLERCENMANNDPDERVREGALAVVSTVYDGSKNVRICEFLARFVCDGSLSEKFRRRAYASLLQVSGEPGPTSLRVRSPRFHFPNDVDWSLVRSYIRE